MKLLQSVWSIFLILPVVLCAQDYTAQYEALKKSVAAKSGTALTPFISSTLEFPPYLPKERLSSALLERVFTDIFKEINTIELKESKTDEIIVAYDFVDPKITDRTSAILFDSEGRITRIKIVEDLIREAQERKLGKDAEQPIADEFTKKFPAKKIVFKTSDDRSVVGELYDIGNNKPVVLLCHQFGYNKYEYADIAPKLNAIGFNALAVDLTGGGTFAAHNNETVDIGKTDAAASNQQVTLDRVKEEIKAAVNFLHKKYNTEVTLWGSSYSANYAISIAAKNEKVNAAISFSGLIPDLSNILSKFNKPVFMTSSKEEVLRVEAILRAVPSKNHVIHFIPKSEGDHGSSVLWNGQPYAEEYWAAVESFLNKIR